MSGLSEAFDGVGSRATTVGAVGGLIALALLVTGLVAPTVLADLVAIATDRGTLGSGLRLAAPITFAALGGIFSEKSGVINIGLEGLLIISAFTGVLATSALGPSGQTLLIPNIWWGVFAAVVASTLLSLLFAVVCIEFEADQIIAGLAVWLIALGLAPFASSVYYGTVNTDNLGRTLGTWTVPVLSEIPYFGAVFDTGPLVYLMFVAVALSWFALNRSSFGKHVLASGENPKALDTVGVDVSRVRYAGVLLSGVLAGFGGAALSLGVIGQFVGTGNTMVNGRGFIAIVVYLFGNYNPIGALGAALFFSGLQAFQIPLTSMGYAVPDALIQTIPYATVIVVLALVGRTRIPEAAGDHYDSGEE